MECKDLANSIVRNLTVMIKIRHLGPKLLFVNINFS